MLFQNANLSLRVSDEFMRAVEEDKPWTTHWVTDPEQGGPHVSGPGNVPKNGPIGVELRRSGRAVRHHHQSLAHLPELRPDQRLESLLGVHVPRRFGLQPGQHKPDEVPPRGRRFRRGAVQGGLPHRIYRPGDPRRSRQLSDEKDHAEQPSFPADRAGILELGQPVDVAGACPTTRTKPGAFAAP